jgi:lysozyme
VAMTLSEKGKQLLSQWEGVALTPYRDAGGVEVIGLGHLITERERLSGQILIGDELVDYREGLTQKQAYDLLGQDLHPCEKTVNESVTVKLEQYQFDALVSFIVNVGIRTFKQSALLKHLNSGDYAAVPEQLRRWNQVGGRIVRALDYRRELEIKLWNGEL